jgi:CRISPR type III-associated protein (TIGR04423 family)
MPYIESNQIDQTALFEGYLWYADQPTARLVHQEAFQNSWLTDFPYIVEGYLYAPGWGSLTVRWLSGSYRIWHTSAAELEQPGTESDVLLEKNRLKTQNAIAIPSVARFKTIWTAQPDEACDGFHVSKPASHVFIGFKD